MALRSSLRAAWGAPTPPTRRPSPGGPPTPSLPGPSDDRSPDTAFTRRISHLPAAAFRAFLTRQEPAYHAYTDTRHVPPGQRPPHGRALGDLAAHWSVIVLRDDPAAYT